MTPDRAYEIDRAAFRVEDRLERADAFDVAADALEEAGFAREASHRLSWASELRRSPRAIANPEAEGSRSAPRLAARSVLFASRLILDREENMILSAELTARAFRARLRVVAIFPTTRSCEFARIRRGVLPPPIPDAWFAALENAILLLSAVARLAGPAQLFLDERAPEIRDALLRDNHFRVLVDHHRRRFAEALRGSDPSPSEARLPGYFVD